jgi:hypothetical protein
VLKRKKGVDLPPKPQSLNEKVTKPHFQEHKNRLHPKAAACMEELFWSSFFLEQLFFAPRKSAPTMKQVFLEQVFCAPQKAAPRVELDFMLMLRSSQSLERYPKHHQTSRHSYLNKK